MLYEPLLRWRPKPLAQDGKQQGSSQDTGQPDEPNLAVAQTHGPLEHLAPSTRANEGQEPFNQKHQGQRREQHPRGRLERSILID